MTIFSLLHRGQAKIYRGLQHSLTRRINEQLELDPLWEMPESWRSQLAEIDNFLAKASGAMTKIHDTTTKITESLSTEQLEAQLRAEFIMAANTFSDDDWAILDGVRATQNAKRNAA